MFNQKKEQKKMKKFWNLMLAALVIFGAVACTENQEENVQQEAGVSFYAKFADDTRAVIEKDGDVWNTKWENGDELTVTCGSDSFVFVYNGEKFSCNASGVNSILNNEVTISGESGDSKSGNKALSIKPVDVQFTSDMTVELESKISFFRFVYTGASEVTLTLNQKAFKNGTTASNTITLSGNANEQFVAIYPTAESAKLTFSLDGVECKNADLTLVSGKVYNLGERTEKVVLLNTEFWSADNPWFAAHFWNASNVSDDVTLTKVSDNLYGCVVPEGMTHVIFCRMNPSNPEFDWSRVFNQTCDFAVASAPNNYHSIISWGASGQKKGRSLWGPKNLASSEISATGIVGSMTDWNPANRYGMLTTNEKDVVVAYAIPVDASGEFKFVAKDTWGGDTGGNGTTKENTWNTKGDQNIKIGKTGVYDIYYNTSTNQYKYVTSK